MRLWSIHPKYLDSKGLVALWREALLAKRVLKGGTSKYRNHPQMKRFKEAENPLLFLNTYLLYIWKEGNRRGYRFDRRKTGRGFTNRKIKVTKGQVKYEFRHLKKKLRTRDPAKYRELLKIKIIKAHPIFTVVKGPVESWEKQRAT